MALITDQQLQSERSSETSNGGGAVFSARSSVSSSRHTRTNTGSRGSNRSAQNSVPSMRSARSQAADACPLTEAQLAPLGLTVQQFLELPIDTREAILTAASPGPSGHASPMSSNTSIVRSASSTATSAFRPSPRSQDSLSTRPQVIEDLPSQCHSTPNTNSRRSSTISPRASCEAHGVAISRTSSRTSSQSQRSSNASTVVRPRPPISVPRAPDALPLQKRSASESRPPHIASSPPPHMPTAGRHLQGRPGGKAVRSADATPINQSQVEATGRPPPAPRRPPMPVSTGSPQHTRSPSEASPLRCVGKMVINGESGSPSSTPPHVVTPGSSKSAATTASSRAAASSDPLVALGDVAAPLASARQSAVQGAAGGRRRSSEGPVEGNQVAARGPFNNGPSPASHSTSTAQVMPSGAAGRGPSPARQMRAGSGIGTTAATGGTENARVMPGGAAGRGPSPTRQVRAANGGTDNARVMRRA